MWVVKIVKTPIVNVYRDGYFPHKVRYKVDAKALVATIKSHQGEAVIEKIIGKNGGFTEENVCG